MSEPGRWWRDLHEDLQDPGFRAAYLQAAEELGMNPDLEQVERIAREQGWTDE